MTVLIALAAAAATATFVLLLYDLIQRRHAILRIFPLIGHIRYLLESIGPEIRQYIITSNELERPFSRDQRSWIYASSKVQNNLSGFGTDADLELATGQIIIRHAAFPVPAPPHPGAFGRAPSPLPAAVIIGELHDRSRAFRPASAINISGMSFGALGRSAVEAMNRGAAIAGCLHNTGEGGLTDHHLHGGELIFQMGTGYFSVRDGHGNFDLDMLCALTESHPVRGVEIKLSQGAKPGLGGLLPGVKVTKEIARYRGIREGVDCISPSTHSAFGTVPELTAFIERIADATGLPVGIKSAVGQLSFWNELAEHMRATGSGPDWITIDGGEGGTGAAPLVFVDHVSMPFKIGFAQVYGTFHQHGMHDQVPFIGSGRLGFPEQALTAMAMGCDMVNVGREAMLSIGCIQSQRCHTDRCPAGVTTHSAWRNRGLVPELKAKRLASYIDTLRFELLELARTCGEVHPALVHPAAIEIIDEHFHARTIKDIFGYAEDWGMPSDADRQRIHGLMDRDSAEMTP